MEFIVVSNDQDKQICYEIRNTVFSIGQNVPIEIERDEFDSSATHFLVKYNEKFVAVARLVCDKDSGIIGRVGVLEQYRGLKIGKHIIENIIEFSKTNGLKTLKLGSQEHAINFYEKLGFQKVGNRYFDANIPHFKMIMKLEEN